MTAINMVVLHYSATFADEDIGRAEIDGWHHARGFNGIGYHYVIRRDGTVEVGRSPETKQGAHVKNQNSGKIGICCVGGLERATGVNVGVDNRTPAQIQALGNLVSEILARHPGAKVVGHRDLAATQCPAYDAAAWWAEWSAKNRGTERPPVKGGATEEDVDPVEVARWRLAAIRDAAVAALAELPDPKP